MRASARDLRAAYALIRAITRIDRKRRHVEMLDLDEVDFSTVPGDVYALFERAHADGQHR